MFLCPAPREDDPYHVAEELTDMMHDITVLSKIHQLAATLRQPGYPVSGVVVMDWIPGIWHIWAGLDTQRVAHLS